MIVHDDINLNKPIFQKVSAEAKEFMLRALTKDPEKRASAKELLDHPWLQTASKDKHVDDET